MNTGESSTGIRAKNPSLWCRTWEKTKTSAYQTVWQNSWTGGCWCIGTFILKSTVCVKPKPLILVFYHDYIILSLSVYNGKHYEWLHLEIIHTESKLKLYVNIYKRFT